MAMRGTADRQETMLTLMTPGKRVPGDHPIRKIKAIADAELERLSPVFDRMYSERGRYSIPPERLRGHGEDGGRDATRRAAHDEASIADRRPHDAASRLRAQPTEAEARAEIFGWMRTVGGLWKTWYRGVERNGLWAYFVASAYNLVRMSKLMPESATG